MKTRTQILLWFPYYPWNKDGRACPVGMWVDVHTRWDVDSHCLIATLCDNIVCLPGWEAEHAGKENLVGKCSNLHTPTENTSVCPTPQSDGSLLSCSSWRREGPLDVTRTQKQNSIPAHREQLTNQAFAECQLVGLKSLIHCKKIREESLELSYDRQRMGQADLLLQ